MRKKNQRIKITKEIEKTKIYTSKKKKKKGEKSHHLKDEVGQGIRDYQKAPRRENKTAATQEHLLEFSSYSASSIPVLQHTLMKGQLHKLT